MGLTKTEQYTERQIQLANLSKALGHPARIAILESIIATKACVCGELVTEIGLAQSTVSQHLKELKAAGLIQGTIDGTSMCYCVNPEMIDLLKEHLVALLDTKNCENNCC